MALPSLEKALALYAAHLASIPAVTAVSQAHVSSAAAALPQDADADASADAADDAATSLPSLVAAAEAGAPTQLRLRGAALEAGSWRCAPLAGCVHAHAVATAGAAALAGAAFLLPPRCRFALGSAAALRSLVPRLTGGAKGGGFRLLILDPPWECVSVARGALYPTLTPWQARARACSAFYSSQDLTQRSANI